MRIFDAHCDVLWRMWENREISFKDSEVLHVTWDGLKKSAAKVQCFAVYVPEKVRQESAFDVALEMIDLFYEEIINKFPNMKLVTTKKDIDELTEGQIGAILSLEGCDAIGTDMEKLRTLYRLGISSVGLTWNHANAVADGILEERGAGLSSFGKQVVKLNNDHFIWTDVSHLSVKGFWDVMDLAEYVIASHSNCKEICPNQRNLSDEQIQALIQKDAAIGVTFVPSFLTSDPQASIPDILRHVEHFCTLGAVNHIGFGSDFDGIDQTVKSLGRMEDYYHLINSLLKYYSETEVKGFLFDNFFKRFPK
ncbi:dipeptidase [Bacillus sp. CHD6a]|uniref:dipeptidase n=1 Tax=Bacillus sp. CHD6a TaxID=1643452 RepID=UPI0006CD5714|nr:dipeptidase [Bacillus sp. CHD6a]KPB03735.1 diguanylate cyclase [Bacillus sp. CHD6a]